jgi:hypothetical protein
MMGKDHIDRALLTAPVLAFFVGVSVAYGLCAPNPSSLFTFLGILPLGICVALVVDARRELWGKQ